MPDPDLPEAAWLEAGAAYRGWHIGDDGEGRLHAALVAAVPLIRAEERERAGARLAELENAITWGTSCLSCSRVLDSATAERERAEKAEARLAEIRAVLLEGGQGDATARCRAIAIVGTGETQQ